MQMLIEKGLFYMEQHSEDVGTNSDLALYRLQSAKSDIRVAKKLSNDNEYKSANNRAYYAIFHAINAIHALDGVAYKRHKDVIGNFNKKYVKTEIFPKDMGRRIAEAEEIRHSSDYDDFYIASKDETEEQIALADELIELVEKYYEEHTK
jgi:uncharacterized protein (UPF0332 family)